MNSFEQKFLKGYIPEGQEIKEVIHEHWIKIVNKLFLFFGLAVFIPTFLYYFSLKAQQYIPFWSFEIYLFLVFFKIIYDIFDWYNDVWIVTNKGIVALHWALFKTDVITVDYENIEGVQVEQDSFWDKVLNKGNLVIHKIGDDSFVLKDAKLPYKAIDEIETIRSDVEEYGEEVDDRFDLVMDALSGVVRDYLGKNGIAKPDMMDYEKSQTQSENIQRSKSKNGTIDLR